MHRYPVNKARSVSKFGRQAARTKALNLNVVVMRGGMRL